MIRCKVCDRQKENGGNGWWALWTKRLFPADRESLSIAPLEAVSGVETAAYEKACGNLCCSKLIERWMQEGSFEAPRSEAAEKV